MGLRHFTTGWLFCTLAALLALSGCGGGGSGTPTAPSPPVITSTPSAAAAEGTTYSYELSATDPVGGPVMFSLTSAPTGAGLNGSTVTWVPAAAQSRVANSFTVTATTSKGGSAKQSWTVTPNGTIHISWVDTFWDENGPSNVPFNWTPVSSLVAALVLQPDGTVRTLIGTGGADGQLSIPNVPAGYFWLRVAPTAMYWTSSSTIDLGADYNGPHTPLALDAPVTTTTLNFNVSGIEPATGGYVQVNLDRPGLQFDRTLLGSETSITTSLKLSTNIDWSQVKGGHVLEYKPVPLGTLSGTALGPSATLRNLTLTNGATNTIDTELAPSPTASLNLSIMGSAWAPLFDHVAPAPATPLSTPFSVAVDPDITNGSPRGNLLMGRTIQLLAPQGIITDPGWNAFAAPIRSRCSASFPFSPFFVPPIAPPILLTNVDMGTVQYGDPFPATWTRYFEICQQATVDVPGADGSASQKMILTNGATVALPGSPVGPITGPVENPTINDMSLFTPDTITAPAITLKWVKPNLGNPTGYTIRVMSPLTLPSGTSTYATNAILSTATTSVTLPPEVMQSGKTYLIVITAVTDGRANMETKPRRTGVPMANAEVVSAPITILTSAP